MGPITVRIENFRSIAKADVELRPGLNVLIGTNGSGKTNILAALKFLRDLFKQGAALALAKSGGPVRNYRRGTNFIRFSVFIDYGERLVARKRTRFVAQWSVTIAQSGPEGIASVQRERLVIGTTGPTPPALSAEVDRRSHTRPRTSFHLAPPEEVGRDLLSIFEQWPKEKKADLFRRLTARSIERLDLQKKNADRTFMPFWATFDETLRDSFVSIMDLNEYNIVPDVARAATDQLPSAEVAPNGSGVAEVIHALENRSYSRLFLRRDSDTPLVHMPSLGSDSGVFHYFPFSDSHARHVQSFYGSKRALFEGLLDRLNSELSLAVRPLTSVTTQVDPTNGRRFVVFRSGTTNFYPEEVSDGTIKWLCILLSIFIPFSRTYLLEEPENFLHPWMQQQLIRLMREQAEKYGTTFMITTHSATILNASLPEEITVVTRSETGTHASHLTQMQEVCDVLETSDFGLGDLWVSGLIGGIPDEVNS